ncbi:MAG: hypothetical protein ACYC6W_10995 [Nitrosotalea sp.]
MPISTNGYYKPTPAKVRKIADSVSGAIKVIGASTIVSSSPMAGLILMVLGEAVNIFSNFFVDDTTT